MLSCNHIAKIDVSRLVDYADISDAPRGQLVLIIPQNGCSTCLNKAYDFMLKNEANGKVKYVFTHYSSTKSIKIRLRILGFKNLSNVYFLKLQDAKSLGVSLMYPSSFTITGDKESSIIIMNAEDSSDWKELSSSVNE